MSKPDQPPIPPIILSLIQTALGPKPRFMPVVGEGMAPTLRHGDFVAVIPVSGFRCDALYVLDLAGEAGVYRCSSNFKGGVDAYKDNPRLGRYTLTRAEFEDAAIGQVLATCNIQDRTLMRGGAA